MKRFLFLVVLLFALGIFVGHAAAQTDTPPTPSPDQVNAVAHNLYCPVCANVPLDACGTAACVQWRQQIADLLTQGYTEQQVYDFFSHQYGPGVLASPPANGINWLIYLLPPLVILAAAVVLATAFFFWRGFGLRKLRVSKRPSGSSAGKYRKQLEKDLKARR